MKNKGYKRLSKEKISEERNKGDIMIYEVFLGRTFEILKLA